MSEAIDKLYGTHQGVAAETRQNSSTALFREAGRRKKAAAEREKATAQDEDDEDEEQQETGGYKMADETEGTPGTRANRAGNPLGDGLPRGNSDPRSGHAGMERKYNSERGGAFSKRYGTGG